jgi:serine/threonine protein kinase
VASFAQTLKSYQTGSLSRAELFATLDRIITDEQADMPWLLQILDQEQSNTALPQEIYQAIRQKIMEAKDKKMDQRIPQAKSQDGGPDFIDEDLSRTQLATSFFQVEKAIEAGSMETDRHLESTPSGPDQLTIKGVGDVLNDRFVLEERVGSGGMSTVYRALDRRKLEADDRDPYVAVKILNVEFRAHPDSLIALQREAKKCHRLAHPNIVRAYDFDRDQATVFMTMEYLSGHSLAKTLRNPSFKGMACGEAMPIIKGMADALAFAHANGIVHADFKPANVILTETGEIKVIDFGIARAFHKPGDGDMEATRFDPGSLGALTPTYASPEMLEHREPDPRDDVYALACIVYEMLTGRHPFGRRQANEARDGGLSLERRSLTRKQWKALKYALAFDRDKRTPSVEQFFKEINPECSRVPAIAAGVGVFALLGGGFGAFQYLDRAEFPLAWFERGNEQTKFVAQQASGGTLAVNEAVAPAVARNNTEEKPAEPVEVAVVEAETLAAVEEIPAIPIQRLSTQQIRASVRDVLDSYACAAMVPIVNDGKVEVHGYIKQTTAVDELTRRLQAMPGIESVDTHLVGLTDTMCDVVELYRHYWIANQENNYGTSIKPGNQSGEFKGGEPLVVELTTPPYRSFVNIDYYSKDGHVVHMLPSPRAEANQAPANYAATLGDLNQWIVSEPFGKEMVVILTTPMALFNEMRKEYERAEDYLAALKDRLAGIDAQSVEQNIAADFVLINTRDR